ncbi:PTS glucose transporter subunit IIA [Tuanshanicoccus lijuaniae]|uniref:PTS sugar transporter subunit IIA n=1 Tax=Aerococcaceae bacterium zg-1292 TaxID=2774330 RepID=UPI0019364F72|nr:PTS glucose transporter subunit IIA [Aerococcaceae bacterium zg-1292]QQA36618.1 PTS glucose transporter subunit IIA [Aerococcaceae bacterium zg-1292]
MTNSFIYDLYAVCDGKLIEITSVSDFTFSSKMMGNGFAFIPENGLISSPIDGEVIQVFPTKHVIGIKNNEIELLVHMGINTVNLKGEPFTSHVSVNERISHGQIITEIDLDKIEQEEEISSEVIVIFFDRINIKSLNIYYSESVRRGQKIGTIELYKGENNI